MGRSVSWSPPGNTSRGNPRGERAPRGLVGRRHGAEVARWAEAARPGVPRLEVVGETAFCYAQDVSALQDSLRNWPELACLHRPANLEDVFLKLTGRELRD